MADLEFNEAKHPPYPEDMPALDALPQYMTIVYLFAAAVKGCTLEERARLHEAQQMLADKAPLRDVGQAILDARGPDWTPDKEWLAAIEAINEKE